jgi:hypothetical protein
MPRSTNRPGAPRRRAGALAALTLAALSLVPGLAAAQGPGADKLYLTIFGTPITDAEITPPAALLDQNRRARTPEGYEAWLANIRVRNLRQTVMGTLQERFLNERGIEPTERTIRGALEVVRRSRVETLNRMNARLDELDRMRAESVERGVPFPEEAKQEQRALREQRENLIRLIDRERELRQEGSRLAVDRAEREKAVAMSRAWLLRKHLHEEYGGRVARVNAAWEPVDAYRDWIWSMEESGDIVFNDARTRVWLYDVLRFGSAQPVEPPADAFDAPPWASLIPPDREPDDTPVPLEEDSSVIPDDNGR